MDSSATIIALRAVVHPLCILPAPIHHRCRSAAADMVYMQDIRLIGTSRRCSSSFYHDHQHRPTVTKYRINARRTQYATASSFTGNSERWRREPVNSVETLND